jgi:hypothetical protein
VPGFILSGAPFFDRSKTKMGTASEMAAMRPLIGHRLNFPVAHKQTLRVTMLLVVPRTISSANRIPKSPVFI